MTLFRNRVFADAIKLKWWYNGLGWAYKKRYPYRKRKIWTLHRHTQRKIPCEDRLNDAFTGQGLPKIVSNHQKPRASYGANRFFLKSLQKESTLSNTLISDFWPSELQEYKFLLFYGNQFVVLCQSSPRKKYSSEKIWWILKPDGRLISLTVARERMCWRWGKRDRQGPHHLGT